MPILTEDVKLMASQRLTDNDDGGGRMTGVEIVDGNVNNLFPDISRLDRVYGRVSLRKGFISIQTPDTETYSGAHVILSEPAKDPLVSVCMFSTGDPNDERTAAQDRLESYVTMGPRQPGWLWGDQPAGSRSILIYQIKGSAIPDIGSVLYLVKDKGLASEKYQYVRITAVEVSNAEFTATSEGAEFSTTAMAFNRDILKLEIGDPLRETFPGGEISMNDALATNVYTSTVSDAAKYYGVMLPTTPLNSGDIAVNVDSIFANLVPSAQGETPMVDIAVGEAGPVVGSGAPFSFYQPSFVVENGAQLYFGSGIKRGYLSITTSTSITYTDNAAGYLMEGGTQRGTVDYSTGTITFTSVSKTTVHLTVEAIIGVEVSRVPNSDYEPVQLANRGYNFTRLLDPLPVPGSVWVDYMSQGKWYRLRDDGKGLLDPDISGTGTGRVDYTTGSLILTCGALPDIDTAIIYNWANPVETVDLAGLVSISVAEISHTLGSSPVQPGTLTITWPTEIDSTAIATDDGSGAITGDADGVIDYATGEIVFKPTVLPTATGEYTIDYDKYAKVEGTVSATGSGLVSFTLPDGPIKVGSVAINLVVDFSGQAHIYTLRDDGAGNLSAPGWNVAHSLSNPAWPGSTTVAGVTGTIDYVTRACQVDLTNVSGTEKWSEPYVEKVWSSISL